MVLIEVFVNCIINVVMTSRVNSAIIFGLVMGSQGEFRNKIKLPVTE